MSALKNLAEVRPEDGPVVVDGFTEDSALKNHLLSFGIVPGVSVVVAGHVPGSRSLILQFSSWQGVLRFEEAQIVQVVKVTVVG